MSPLIRPLRSLANGFGVAWWARVQTSEASEAAAPPEAPVEQAPEQRIELDLNPSQPAVAPQFDQNIQLSP